MPSDPQLVPVLLLLPQAIKGHQDVSECTGLLVSLLKHFERRLAFNITVSCANCHSTDLLGLTGVVVCLCGFLYLEKTSQQVV